ncbi:MAG: signal peptidase II [Phycisphaerales bacterium]|nr:signal peptidase II [Phycisphaerales bacterium]
MTSPFRSRRAWTILLVVTVLGLVIDLASKSIAFERIADAPVSIDRAEVLERLPSGTLSALLPPHDPVVVIPRVLEFTLVLNPGAVFGIGGGKRVFFIVFTFVAVAFVLWIFGTWTRARDTLSHVAIGLLLSGGLGNLYDRILFGCVRDFIHPLPGVRVAGREIWPYVSNLADLFLLVGIAILMLRSWRKESGPEKDPSAEATSDQPTDPATSP